ncbi:MAG: hypothetical protein ACUVTG_00995 [Candidatus Oleimicrobiaceae bacterium]
MRVLALSCIVICVLWACLPLANAQEGGISELVHRAQGACEEGRYLEAARVLREALRQVNRIMLGQMEALLPKPERGWEVLAVQSDADESLSHTGLKVRGQYVKSGSHQMVEVEIAVGAPAAGNLMLWLTNPIQLERASEGRRLLAVGTRRWVGKYDERDLTAELATVVGMDRVVRVSGFNLSSLEPAEKYAAHVPLERLERLFR